MLVILNSMTDFFEHKQQEFIAFILQKYVEGGMQALAESKIRSMVELKYITINAATIEFGSASVIHETFVGFQKYLYEQM